MEQSPPTNDPMLRELTYQIEQGKCIAFIGAGMSMPDYPDWVGLVRELSRECRFPITAEAEAQLPLLADKIREHDPRRFQKKLLKIFSRVVNPKCADRYHLLARIPFASYMTTNYDPLLLDILDLHRNCIYSEYPYFETEAYKNGEISYLHGRINPRKPNADDFRIVLTQSDYKEAYHSSGSPLRPFLEMAFHQHDVCFLGCGHEDRALREILKISEARRHRIWNLTTPNRPRFFFVVDQHSDVPENIAKENGLNLVTFPRCSHDFSGLDDLLKYWAKIEGPVQRRPETRGTNPFLSEGGLAR